MPRIGFLYGPSEVGNPIAGLSCWTSNFNSTVVAGHSTCALERTEKWNLTLYFPTSDTEEVYPSRSELSALMGLVNEELQRRIEVADNTIQSLRTVLSQNGAQ